MIYLQPRKKSDVKKVLPIIFLSLSYALAPAQGLPAVTVENGSLRRGAVFPEISPLDTVTLTIVGDVMMHSAQIENARKRRLASTGNAPADDPGSYDFGPCLAGIRDMLSAADITVANMEFTHSGPPYSGYPAFSAPESYSDYIADCGVDVFLTANNHILDGGAAGALRTIGVYRSMSGRGIHTAGCFADSVSLASGQPLILECRGLRVAILNFTYGTNVEPEGEWPKVCLTDRAEMLEALKRARRDADIVIAIPHWGVEYRLAHSREQEDVARFLATHGADAIIGGHPHVVQDTGSFERFPVGEIPVVYSLGNLISNMSARDTQIGLVVTLPLVRYSDGSARVADLRYTLTWCSLPGGLTDCHATVPVREMLGRRDEWLNPSDYDKMVSTYNRIQSTSGIHE